MQIVLVEVICFKYGFQGVDIRFFLKGPFCFINEINEYIHKKYMNTLNRSV